MTDRPRGTGRSRAAGRFRQPSLFLFESAAAGAVADVFDPARLTQARVLAGFTKQALAGVLEVSPAAVGQYEAGIHHPAPGSP